MSYNTLRTKVASGVLIKIQKVISPDLNEGLTILWSISRFNSENAGLQADVRIANYLRVYSICRGRY